MSLPPRILIDLATRCNLRCPMCPVWGQSDDVTGPLQGTMDSRLLRAILAEVEGKKAMVQPSLYGEPLVAHNWRESLEQMAQAGLAIALNTNGLTLDGKNRRFLLDLPVASVFVSVDAFLPTTYARVRGVDRLKEIEENIWGMVDARGERTIPRIGVSFVRQPGNEGEEESFIQKWLPVVDVVRVSALFDKGTFVNARGVPPVRTPCPVLWDTMPIHNDGQVTICCLDGEKTTNMGNVREGVRKVWEGRKFSAARQAHLEGRWEDVPFCASCNGWAQSEQHTTEEVRDGVLIRSNPIHTYYNRLSAIESWRGALVRIGGAK